ncbi:hypothetical protein [Rubripirellula reticaptiva]|uniref:Uncharacterized protein n=1 Tax=Rubripirellula reticaptiva TaxID=2528013 RepID=A0A5C6EDX1_9BACT|nr:hypothetical protein [Rubripirellula reticaptiva]TWU47028.1 hypothetical protein Poly59_60020 [Rubripirellula reticaptiva]
MNQPNEIVPGIKIDSTGHAMVDSSMQDILFDLALALEAPTNLPVDMQHVVAALMLASRDGHVNAETAIRADDATLIETLVPYVKSVFQVFGGELGAS